jgi:hypothetical protein
MDYILRPYIGFNDIRFGMTSEEISKLMWLKPTHFKKGDDENNSDMYEDFFVYYSNNGEADAFEFFPPAKIKLISDFLPQTLGEDLFSIPFEKINELLLNSDKSAEDDGYGMVSEKVGIGTYREDFDNINAESIIIFKKGYYELT